MVKCIKIEKRRAREIFPRIKRYMLKEYKVVRDEKYLYVPVKEEYLEELQKIGFQIVERAISPRPKRLTINEILGKKKGKFRIDRIGDVAIIETDMDIRDKAELIAKTIGVRSLFLRAGLTRGTYRIRPVELLWGDPSTLTTHVENECRFLVDVEKCFFNPRNAAERARVASLVSPCENVVDMFAGVGTFAIQIAKRCAKVEAVDINPFAIELLIQNIKKNRVETLVNYHLGDIREIAPVIGRHRADRIIMDYPDRSLEYVDVAAYLAKEKITLHIYLFAKDMDEAVQKITNALTQNWMKPIDFRRGIKREVAPNRYYIGVDVFAKLTHSLE